MRSNLLISTAAAALLAGTVFAAAQGGQRPVPGGMPEPHAQGQSQGQEHGQGPRNQDQGKTQKGKRSQAPASSTTGQGQREGAPSTQGQGQGQQGERQQGQQPKTQQAPKQNGAAEGRGSGQQSGGNASLTTEQRTTIRQTVLQGNNAPRVANVNFSINVGTVVPASVRVVALPPPLIEIYPSWRGYLYFIVGDRIVVLEPRSKRIVAVLVV